MELSFFSVFVGGKIIYHFLTKKLFHIYHNYHRKGNIVFIDHAGNIKFHIDHKENIIFQCIFSEDYLLFSVQKGKPYFWEKEIPSFPVTQEISYSSVIFGGRSSFPNRNFQKEMRFLVQRNINQI